MAKKKSKRLISKKTKKKAKAAAPWAIAAAATGGLIAALAGRGLSSRVRSFVAHGVGQLTKSRRTANANGMTNGIASHESGAV